MLLLRSSGPADIPLGFALCSSSSWTFAFGVCQSEQMSLVPLLSAVPSNGSVVVLVLQGWLGWSCLCFRWLWIWVKVWPFTVEENGIPGTSAAASTGSSRTLRPRLTPRCSAELGSSGGHGKALELRVCPRSLSLLLFLRKLEDASERAHKEVASPGMALPTAQTCRQSSDGFPAADLSCARSRSWAGGAAPRTAAGTCWGVPHRTARLPACPGSQQCSPAVRLHAGVPPAAGCC